jgi:di/tricarboxylate transporter
LLALIFAMLAVGAALEQTGAVALVVGTLAPSLEGLPPVFLVWAVYFITTFMTELVSNNAIAVIMAPIAIALAEATGVDARPLLDRGHDRGLGLFRHAPSATRPTCWSTGPAATASPTS